MAKKSYKILFCSAVFALILFYSMSILAATAPNSTYLSTISGSLNSPSTIAVGVNGKIYVADPYKDRVQVYSPSGILKYTAQNFLGIPLSIAVDVSGNIYVGEDRTKSVMVFDANWKYIKKLGSGDREFYMPGDIAISASTGRIYVTDSGNNSVKMYNPDGSFYASFGVYGASAGQFNFPAGVAVDDANSEVLVGDQMNRRIQIFDLEGNYKATIGSIDRMRGIAVDSLGRIYAVDAFQGHIKVYDRNGSQLATIGSFGDKKGELSSPSDVLIDSNNRLLITSTQDGKVVMYGIDNYTIPVDPPDIYTLTVSKSGNGAVTGSPAGINCGTECSASYEAGTAISLSAAPASDSLFTGWSGDCAGSGGCSVTMESNKAVAASFALETTPPQLTLNQPQPSVLSPANSKMIPVTVSGSASDSHSGLKTVSYAVDDEYNKLDSTGTITPDNNGNFSLTINLQAYRDKKDSNGRVYTITVTATDKANNNSQASVTVTVPK